MPTFARVRNRFFGQTIVRVELEPLPSAWPGQMAFSVSAQKNIFFHIAVYRGQARTK
jgi:hypothetical protein